MTIKVYIEGAKVKNEDKEVFVFKGEGGEEAARELAERYPKVIYFFDSQE